MTQPEMRELRFTLRVNTQDDDASREKRDKLYRKIIGDLDLLPESLLEEIADEVYTARANLVVSAAMKHVGPVKVMRVLQGGSKGKDADSIPGLEPSMIDALWARMNGQQA